MLGGRRASLFLHPAGMSRWRRRSDDKGSQKPLHRHKYLLLRRRAHSMRKELRERKNRIWKMFFPLGNSYKVAQTWKFVRSLFPREMLFSKKYKFLCQNKLFPSSAHRNQCSNFSSARPRRLCVFVRAMIFRLRKREKIPSVLSVLFQVSSRMVYRVCCDSEFFYSLCCL